MKGKILSLLLLLVWVFPSLTYAQSTATYVLTDTDCGAFDRLSDTSNPPPSPYDSSWEILTSGPLGNMAANDGNRYETRRTTARDQFDSQLYRFRITQNLDLVSQLDFSWLGYGEDEASYSCYFYIWNFDTGAWELLQQADIGTSDGTLAGTISSNITDYITADGIIYVVSQSKHYNYAPTSTLSGPIDTAILAIGTTQTTLSWSRNDEDIDTLESFCEIRRAGQSYADWGNNSGWISGTSWLTSGLANGFTYYWHAQSRDDIATGSFTGEWNFWVDDGSGTCPFVFAWTGDKYEFIDEIGNAGYALYRDKKVMVYRPDNLILGESLKTEGGYYKVKFREGVHETTFIDHAELIIVDHPKDYEIVSTTTERKIAYDENGVPYFVEKPDLYAISKNRRVPVSAKNETGQDVLEQIKDLDNTPLKIDEYKEVNAITLDFGKIESHDVKLVIEGWTYVKFGKNRETKNMQGYIELMGNDGNWTRVKNIGYISGQSFSTMAIDLSGLFEERKDYRIRLNLYCSQITLGSYDRITLDTAPLINIKEIRVPASEAHLSFAGGLTFKNRMTKESSMTAECNSQPVAPDMILDGQYTRYGDVSELVTASDDHMVIIHSGDQVDVKFKALGYNPPEGMTRSFALFSRSYYRQVPTSRTLQKAYKIVGVKPNEARPLPYMSMPFYPYTSKEGAYPMTQENIDYLKKYNTRLIKSDITNNIHLLRSGYQKNMNIRNTKLAYRTIAHSLNTNYVECKVTYNGSGVAPSVPNLNFPSDTAIDINNELTLIWQASSGTQPITYQLQIDTDNAFPSPDVDVSEIENEFYVTSLNLDMQYYWRVKATNAFGTSLWSEIWSFTTGDVPTAPVLTSPSDTVTNVELTPNYSWSTSTGSAPISYILQVDDEVTFSNPLIMDLANIYINSYNPGVELSEGTTYYWQVKAINSFGESSWSTAFSFTTGFKPTVPMLASPNDTATNMALPITLNWNASAGSPIITYTIQVDDDPGFASAEYNQGYILDTSFSITNLNASTTYYWKVIASNAVGDSSESSIWSFTTAAAGNSPSIPVLSLPSDTSANVNINPTLSWSPSSGSTPITYRIQVDTDSSFSGPVEYTTNTQWYSLGSLNYSTTYYWKVRGENIEGNGDWSDYFVFTIMAEPESNTAPTIPVLNLPSNGAINLDIDYIFDWLPTSGTSPITYNFEIALDEDMTLPLYSNTGVTNNYNQVLDLPYGNTLYWRVKAVNAYGESAWSAVWDFTTKDEPSSPAEPQLVAPSDTAESVDIKTILAWKEVSSDNITYSLKIGLDSEMTNLWNSYSKLSSTYYQINDMDYDTTYYWQVKAVDEFGESDWSSIWSFSTKSEDTTSGSTTPSIPPNVPVLISPDDGVVELATVPILKWTPSSNTDATYWIQVSRDKYFSDLILSKYSLHSAEYQPTGTFTYTTYWWRVRAINMAGMSDWSASRSFTIGLTTPTEEDKQKSGCFVKFLFK